jgi:hypothetical protein
LTTQCRPQDVPRARPGASTTVRRWPRWASQRATPLVRCRAAIVDRRRPAGPKSVASPTSGAATSAFPLARPVYMINRSRPANLISRPRKPAPAEFVNRADGERAGASRPRAARRQPSSEMCLCAGGGGRLFIVTRCHNNLLAARKCSSRVVPSHLIVLNGVLHRSHKGRGACRAAPFGRLHRRRGRGARERQAGGAVRPRQPQDDDDDGRSMGRPDPIGWARH